ncbi:GNAT family acetyltransferase [Stagonosporopsis vannaccii]|nr:GNAT family acetyltransferase [Stagonosporopsis vannaccii]
MTSQHREFIEVPIIEGTRTTIPVDEAKRLAAAEIKIEPAEEEDAIAIAEGTYKCFSEESIAKMEPPHLRPPYEVRLKLLAKKIQPSLTQPGMHWLKAVHIPTNTIIGVAAWASPDLPLYNIFRRSAIRFYGWQARMGWTDAEIDEMYAHVDDEVWSGNHAKNDEIRDTAMNGQPHWYLAQLITWPEWQGRGVGKRLLNWAIEQADKQSPPTPMYLEASAMSRAVYMHVGFVQQGEKNFIRRGPRVARALGEGETAKVQDKDKKVDAEIVAKELKQNTAP